MRRRQERVATSEPANEEGEEGRTDVGNEQMGEDGMEGGAEERGPSLAEVPDMAELKEGEVGEEEEKEMACRRPALDLGK